MKLFDLMKEVFVDYGFPSDLIDQRSAQVIASSPHLHWMDQISPEEADGLRAALRKMLEELVKEGPEAVEHWVALDEAYKRHNATTN